MSGVPAAGVPAGTKPDAPAGTGPEAASIPLGPVSLDLDVFEGPFDLLVTLILNEEIDLLDVHLAEVVIAYLERLEVRGELDLEAATEFLVLIAALLELKSRLMLPGEELEGLEIEPGEAVEELLARLVEYRKFRAAAEHLRERLEAERGYRFRSAPLPAALRRVSIEAAGQVYRPEALGEAMRALLRTPPAPDTSHLHTHTVSLERRLAALRGLLGRRGAFSFDEAVRGADRMTVAVTLFALLELYKSGELVWRQRENFGEIEIVAAEGA